MYSNVIVPLDGSELSEMALPYARLIAGGLAIPIELVESFDILPPAVHHRHSALVTGRMLEEAQRHSQSYLSRVREGLRSIGIAASVSTLPGAPARAITDWAGREPDALVVMSTHGRGGIARWAAWRTRCCTPSQTRCC